MILAMLAASTGSAMQSVFLVVLPLAGSILLAYGVFHVAMDLRTGQRKRVVDRLKGEGTRGRSVNEKIDFDTFRKQTLEATGMLAQAFTRLSFTARFQRIIEQANLPWSAPQTLVNLTAIAAVVLAILLVLQVSLVIAIGVAAAAFVLPVLYLIRRPKKPINKLTQQLPDVFELLSQALRAGNSLASAMQLVATELPDPAGTEFGRVFHEQNLGLKIEDALIRERIQLYGTVQALTAEGRLSGYVLLALPVIVFIALQFVNPKYITLLLTDPTGKMMLTTAIVMQLMGWAMIKKIVNIKVKGPVS